MAGTEAFLDGLNPPLKGFRAVGTGRETALTPTALAQSGCGVPAAELKPLKMMFFLHMIEMNFQRAAPEPAQPSCANVHCCHFNRYSLVSSQGILEQLRTP